MTAMEGCACVCPCTCPGCNSGHCLLCEKGPHEWHTGACEDAKLLAADQAPQRRDWAEAARVLDDLAARLDDRGGGLTHRRVVQEVGALADGAEACARVTELERKLFDLAGFTADVVELLSAAAPAVASWARFDAAAEPVRAAIGKALDAQTDTLAAGRRLRRELERLRAFEQAIRQALIPAAWNGIDADGKSTDDVLGEVAGAHHRFLIATARGGEDQATQDTAVTRHCICGPPARHEGGHQQGEPSVDGLFFASVDEATDAGGG